jgi:sRNA-binding protein
MLMTRPLLPLVIGSWVLTGGMAIAAPPPAALHAVPAVRLVADGDFSATKDKYVEHARDQMAEWRHKIDAVGDKAGAQARDTAASAESDLNVAWRKAQAEANRLQGTGQDGWERVKGAFENASRDLTDTWNRAHPDAK